MNKYRNPYVCPECGKPGRYRNGVGFEHEKICMSDNHSSSVVWCPDEIEFENQTNAINSENVNGDGI